AGRGGPPLGRRGGAALRRLRALRPGRAPSPLAADSPPRVSPAGARGLPVAAAPVLGHVLSAGLARGDRHRRAAGRGGPAARLGGGARGVVLQSAPALPGGRAGSA